jgi:hypothetical protein
MKFKSLVIAPLLAAGAAAAISAAPLAVAAPTPHQDCSYAGSGNSLCQSPGNAQIVATPPPVTYQSLYPYGFGYGTFLFGGGNHYYGGHR